MLHDLSHRRLVLALRTALWVVLALGLGNAWASRSIGPLDLHQAEGLVQSDSAQDGRLFLRARWMDPTTGRFVSEDPYEGKLDKPSSLHRYLYANQSPVNFVDPNGRFGLLEISAGLAAMSVVGVTLRFTLFDHTEAIQSLGDGAIPGAKAMIQSAIVRLQTGDPSIAKWFGPDAASETVTLIANYEALGNALSRHITFYKLHFSPHDYGQAFKYWKDHIWLTEDLFSRTPSSRGFSTKSGIVIHEASHYELGNEDLKYFPVPCIQWAKTAGFESTSRNADTYEYFAEAASGGEM